MRDDINPTTLMWLDEQRANRGDLSLTDILTDLGVRIEDRVKTLNAWGWRRNASPAHILTVWAEQVEIGDEEIWESENSLKPSGNPTYSSDQVLRENERIGMLKELAESGQNCKAILMINQRSKEQDALGQAAKASFRAVDDQLWHVEASNKLDCVKLRRGPKSVSKPDENPQPELDTSDFDDEQDKDVQLRYPNQETRDRVEHAAIEFAKKEYAAYGCVKSVESQNLGYDLEVTSEQSGEVIKMVEVKGTSGDEENFFLTRNELRKGRESPRQWRLAIVVNALSSPTLQEYRCTELENSFDMDPLVWRCTTKRTS
ncbi:DUF3883 domain-containing protein [Janthinobacterium tructae]|uniref:DUF3883 domain-containing protein n=1 Tax=Janthinobacterium tructae TaxID=2590869 RepID=UPI00249A9A5E|nr:DUF3883 domain-containing protein [Janthinobacterium tructae]MDI3292505.1 DUF3883 domain-containing protein [Janthinobacterium tructae]